MKLLIARNAEGTKTVAAFDAERFELVDDARDESKFIEVDHPDWETKAERFIVEICRMLEVERFAASQVDDALIESLGRIGVAVQTRENCSYIIPCKTFASTPEEIAFGLPFKRGQTISVEYGPDGLKKLWETAIAPLLATGIDVAIHPMIRGSSVQVHWDAAENRYDVFDQDGFSRKAAFSKLQPLLRSLECDSCIFTATAFDRSKAGPIHPAHGLWRRDNVTAIESTYLYATRLIEQDGKPYVDEPLIDSLTRLSILIGEGKRTHDCELEMMATKVLHDGATSSDITEQIGQLVLEEKNTRPVGYWFLPLHGGTTASDGEQLFALKHKNQFTAIVTGVRNLPADKPEGEHWGTHSAAASQDRLFKVGKYMEATFAIEAGDDKLLPVRVGGRTLDESDFEMIWNSVEQNWGGQFDQKYWTFARGFEPAQGDLIPTTVKVRRDFTGEGLHIGDVIGIRAGELSALGEHQENRYLMDYGTSEATMNCTPRPTNIRTICHDMGLPYEWWEFECIFESEVRAPRRIFRRKK